jgi:hypothetical protein
MLDDPFGAVGAGVQGERMASRLHLHLDADAMDDLVRGVVDAPGRLGRHMHDTAALTIPALDRFHDVPVGGQLRAIRRDVVHRPVIISSHQRKRTFAKCSDFLALSA